MLEVNKDNKLSIKIIHSGVKRFKILEKTMFFKRVGFTLITKIFSKPL